MITLLELTAITAKIFKSSLSSDGLDFSLKYSIVFLLENGSIVIDIEDKRTNAPPKSTIHHFNRVFNCTFCTFYLHMIDEMSDV